MSAQLAVVREPADAAMMEQVVVVGDLTNMRPAQRVMYYNRVLLGLKAPPNSLGVLSRDGRESCAGELPGSIKGIVHPERLAFLACHDPAQFIPPARLVLGNHAQRIQCQCRCHPPSLASLE